MYFDLPDNTTRKTKKKAKKKKAKKKSAKKKSALRHGLVSWIAKNYDPDFSGYQGEFVKGLPGGGLKFYWEGLSFWPIYEEPYDKFEALAKKHGYDFRIADEGFSAVFAPRR